MSGAMSTPLIRTLRISPSMSTSSSHAPRSVAPVKYTLRNHARLKSTCSNRAPDKSRFTNSVMRTASHRVPTSGDAHWSTRTERTVASQVVSAEQSRK
jgi:hypothetical protein